MYMITLLIKNSLVITLDPEWRVFSKRAAVFKEDRDSLVILVSFVNIFDNFGSNLDSLFER